MFKKKIKKIYRSSCLGTLELVSIVKTLKLFISSGKGWREALRYLSSSVAGESVSSWSREILIQCETQGAAHVLKSREARAKGLESLVIKSIGMLEQGLPHSVKALKTVHDILLKLKELKQEERSQLFLPLAQSILVMIVFGVFAVLIPNMMPQLFPSFLHLGRVDDFSIGCFFLFLGVYLVWFFAKAPGRQMMRETQFSLFLFELHLYLSLDSDFVAAWDQSIAGKSKLEGRWHELMKSRIRTVSLCELVSEFSKSFSGQESVILDSIAQKHENGSHLDSFFKETCEEYFEDYLQRYRLKAKMASFVSLVPLSFCALPSVFYLMLGPQFVILAEMWSLS